MMSISVSAISEILNQAFRAACLLTGRADMAENAVLDGIAGLESNDAIEKALVAKTIESVIRQRADFPNQVEHALALLPHELQRLILLAPVSRDCFILRVLFGITPANCAAILNLTIEQFKESLYAAFQQFTYARRSDLLARSPTSNTRSTPMTTEQKPIGLGFGAHKTGEEALGSFADAILKSNRRSIFSSATRDCPGSQRYRSLSDALKSVTTRRIHTSAAIAWRHPIMRSLRIIGRDLRVLPVTLQGLNALSRPHFDSSTTSACGRSFTNAFAPNR